MATMRTVVKMLFVNPLDLLVEAATRLLANIMSWRPDGTRVVVAVLDPLEPPQRVKGRIVQVLSKVVTVGPNGITRHSEPFLVVQLEAPLYFDGEKVERLVAGSRYELNAFTRLILMGWIANLHRVPMEGKLTVSECVLNFSDFIGIGGLKRTGR
jgi:hypothetical protein